MTAESVVGSGRPHIARTADNIEELSATGASVSELVLTLEVTLEAYDRKMMRLTARLMFLRDADCQS